jgi:purine-nucleoside phosphorylase
MLDLVEDALLVPYQGIDGTPVVAGHVRGHKGELALGYLSGVPVAVFAGRYHAYQGVNALDAAFTARVAAALGAGTIVLTNASGGVAAWLSPGDLLLVCDHLNLTGMNPLVGWPGPEGGVPFVPMRDAYDPLLRELALQVAEGRGMTLHEGVYAGLLGPSFETPAEVEMYRKLGADAVGMSTVLETIVARALGMRVLGISLVANSAAAPGLSHQEVLDAGARAAESTTALLLDILARL